VSNQPSDVGQRVLEMMIAPEAAPLVRQAWETLRRSYPRHSAQVIEQLLRRWVDKTLIPGLRRQNPNDAEFQRRMPAAAIAVIDRVIVSMRKKEVAAN